MEIKTKLNIGEDCYFMFDNKVLCLPVEKIYVTVSDSGTSVNYVVPNGKEHIVNDDNVFTTKPGLLASL